MSTDQLDFFRQFNQASERRETLPHNGTPTSAHAASLQTATKVHADRMAILRLAEAAGERGIVRADCERIGMVVGTYCPRVKECVNRGWLEPLYRDGKPVRREVIRDDNPDGEHATAQVLVLTDKGRVQLTR
jgi:hypothetical protein